RLRGLLHDVAELPGQAQPALAAHGERLHEEHVAAHGGPRESGRDADLVALELLVLEVLDGAQHLLDRRGRDPVAPRLALRDGDRDLAADRADLALEVAQAR